MAGVGKPFIHSAGFDTNTKMGHLRLFFNASLSTVYFSRLTKGSGAWDSSVETGSWTERLKEDEQSVRGRRTAAN